MKFVPKKLEQTADISAGYEGWRKFARNCALVAVFFCLLYLVLGWTSDYLVMRIPDAWEADYLALDLGGEDDPTDEDFQRCKRLFERLIKTPGLRKLNYKLTLVDDTETPNAFAAPGGMVGVTRMLLDEVKSETGLAMVLSHELGHHQFRHTLTGLGRSIVYGLTMALLFGDSGAGTVADYSVTAAERSHSRHQESAADAFGLELVQKTLGTTEGALEFFEVVHEKYRQGDSKWMSYFSSHPFTLDRIKQLRALQARLAAQSPASHPTENNKPR